MSWSSHHNSLEAELLGVIHAIKIAWGENWFNLWIENDSTNLVKAFSTKPYSVETSEQVVKLHEVAQEHEIESLSHI